MEIEKLVETLRRTITGAKKSGMPHSFIAFMDNLKSGKHMTCPVQLNRNRAIATAAKVIADDPTLPDELAGVLLQMCGAGNAKPYEVCDE